MPAARTGKAVISAPEAKTAAGLHILGHTTPKIVVEAQTCAERGKADLMPVLWVCHADDREDPNLKKKKNLAPNVHMCV